MNTIEGSLVTLKKRSIIVLNMIFIGIIFFSHWFILWQIMTGLIERWYVLSYNLLIFDWAGMVSVIDFCPLLMVLMIVINVLLYMKEKE